MKNSYACWILLLVVVSTVYGQNKPIDSLKLLVSQSPPDSILAVYYNNLSSMYLNSNMDSALKFGTLAITLSQGKNLIKAEADGNTNVGVAIFRLGYHDSAKYYYDAALRLYQEVGDEREIARANVRLATYFDSKGYFDLSIRANNEAIASFEVLKDTFNLGIAYYNLASTYGYKNERDKEVEHYLISLELTKAINDTEGIAWAYSGLFTAYSLIKNYEEAYKALQKEEKIRKALGAPYYIGKVFYNYSTYFEAIGQYDSSMYYAHKALEIFEENGYKDYEAACYDQLGVIHHANKSYQKSIEAYENSLAIIQTISGDKAVVTLKDMAITFIALGKWDQARTTLDRALKQSKEFNSELETVAVLEQLYKLDSISNNWQSAFNHLQQLSNLKNELTRKENTNRLQELNIIFETEQRDLEITNLKQLDVAREEKLQAEIKQKYYLTIATVVTLVFLVIGIILYNRLRHSKNEIAQQKNSLELLNQTKDRFFGIIAHDLRGPITALKGITDLLSYNIKKGKMDSLPKIAAQIDSSSNRVNSLLDNLLSWALSQQGTVPYSPSNYPLKDLVEESLLYFEDMAAAKQIEIKCDIPSELTIFCDKESLSTVFRNLINNSIKFTHSGGCLTINSESKDNRIDVLLKDDGIGMSPEKVTKIFSLDSSKIADGTAKEKGSGLGLMLVKDFIAMNKGQINVSSKPNEGSEFLISLPVA